ncbi:MAG: riboflavin synthase [Bdellovibrio sp.]|nr:MAG: riboflavin synthase [Bdellovibrio sp.]
MFSGIIEAQGQCVSIQELPQALQLKISRPSSFKDLKRGDSIAVDGVCLTVEDLQKPFFQVTIGFETLQVTRWTPSFLERKLLNLERSMIWGDRNHGHWVTGHVDGVAQVTSVISQGPSRLLTLRLSSVFYPYLWPKGSVALNGVSLTVNKVGEVAEQKGFLYLDICLIPETLRKTNLSQLEEGDMVNFELDQWARAFVHWRRLQEEGYLFKEMGS